MASPYDMLASLKKTPSTPTTAAPLAVGHDSVAALDALTSQRPAQSAPALGVPPTSGTHGGGASSLKPPSPRAANVGSSPRSDLQVAVKTAGPGPIVNPGSVSPGRNKFAASMPDHQPQKSSPIVDLHASVPVIPQNKLSSSSTADYMANILGAKAKDLLGKKADELFAARAKRAERRAEKAAEVSASLGTSSTLVVDQPALGTSGTQPTTEAPAKALKMTPLTALQPVAPVASAPLTTTSATTAKTVDPISESGAPRATAFMQSQIARLQGELDKKDEELRKANARVDEAEATADSWRQSHQSMGSSAQAAAQEARVELDKSRVQIKNMQLEEERQKQKYDSLVAAQAEERIQKDTQISELTKKLKDMEKANQFQEKKLQRLEELIQQKEEEIGLKAKAIEANTAQLVSVNAIATQQKTRVEELTKEMDVRSEKLTGDFSLRIADMKRELDAIKVESRNKTIEIEVLRSEGAAGKQQFHEGLAQKDAEMSVYKTKMERELEKAQQLVAAMGGGRGRLEEVQALQQQLDKKEAEWIQEKAGLQQQIQSLTQDVENLAIANADLTSAMDGNSGAVELLNTTLDKKGMEARVKQLGDDLLIKTERAEELEKQAATLKDELAAAGREIRDKQDRIQQLESRLEASKQETTLLNTALESAKASMAAAQKEHVAKETGAATQMRQLEASITELQAKAGDLEARLKDKTSKLDTAEREFKALKTKVDQEAAERAAEEKGIRERLSEAIQERCMFEDRLEQMIKAQEKAAQGGPSGAASASDLEAKVRDVTRQLQDAQGEAKRAKTASQDAQRKLDAAKQQQQEASEANAELKKENYKLTQELLDMEHDLEIAENQCDEYEKLINGLRAELGQVAAPPSSQ